MKSRRKFLKRLGLVLSVGAVAPIFLKGIKEPIKHDDTIKIDDDTIKIDCEVNGVKCYVNAYKI